jgi:hypothetical protein
VKFHDSLIILDEQMLDDAHEKCYRYDTSVEHSQV